MQIYPLPLKTISSLASMLALLFASPATLSAAPSADDPETVLDMVRTSLPQSCSHKMELTFHGAEEQSALGLTHTPEADAKWTLNTVNGEPATEKQLSRMTPPNDLITEGAGTLSGLLDGAVFELHDMSDEMYTYHADTLPKGTVTVSGSDISKHMRAELTVDMTGMGDYIVKTRLIAKKSFRFKVFARVTEATEVRHYTLNDGQWLVPADIDLEYTARLFGRLITERETRHFSDFECNG